MKGIFKEISRKLGSIYFYFIISIFLIFISTLFCAISLPSNFEYERRIYREDQYISKAQYLEDAMIYTEDGRYLLGNFKYNQNQHKWFQYGKGIIFYPDGSCVSGKIKKEVFIKGWKNTADGKRCYISVQPEANKETGIYYTPADTLIIERMRGEDIYIGRYYYAQGGYYQGLFKDSCFYEEGTIYDAKNQPIHTEKQWKMMKPKVAYQKYLSPVQTETPPKNEETKEKKQSQKEQASAATESIANEEKVSPSQEEIKILPRAITYTATLNPQDARQRREKDAFYLPKIDTDGEIASYSDRIKDGKLTDGYAEIVWKNGHKYRGQIKNRKPHGKGEIILNNGEFYNGNWNQGRIKGQGTYYRTSYDYLYGTFSDGQINGKGVHYYQGKIVYNGVWKNGSSVKTSKTKK